MDGPSGPPFDPLRRRARRRRLALLIVALGLVVALVGVLPWMAPLVRPGSPVTVPGARGQPDLGNATFLADLVVAHRWVANLSGGPWTLVGGFSLTDSSPTRLPLDATGASPCPLLPSPYPSMTSVQVPAQSSVIGAGTSSFWTYDFEAPGGTGVRVAVDAGHARTLGALALSGAGCPPASRPPFDVPASIVDSSAVAETALQAGGAEVLAQFDAPDVTYTLAPLPEPGLASGSAEQWNVTFDGCGVASSPDGIADFAQQLSVYLDARSGVVEATHAWAATCPLGPSAPIPYSLAQALLFNAPVRSVAGPSAYYNASVAEACCGLGFGNLSPQLLAVGSGPIPSRASLLVYGTNGTGVCEGLANGSGLFVMDCRAEVSSGDLFSLVLPSGGSGALELSLESEWDFAGSVVLALENATALPG